MNYFKNIKLFSIYVLFHFSVQGLIVGSESNSDTSGISQIIHFYILQVFFTYSIFYVWPHNVMISFSLSVYYFAIIFITKN
jgi:hypothetical protein